MLDSCVTVPVVPVTVLILEGRFVLEHDIAITFCLQQLQQLVLVQGLIFILLPLFLGPSWNTPTPNPF